MTFTFFGVAFQLLLLWYTIHGTVHYPVGISTNGLASFAFARHYSRNLGWFLFLFLLRCFSSEGSLRMTMYSSYGSIFCMEGFPIRKSADITAICASPQLIAACHVLRRLPMPRHSPCALISLNSFFISFMIWCMSYRKSVFLLVVILFTLRLERP